MNGTPVVQVHTLKLTLDPADTSIVASLGNSYIGLDVMDGMLEVTTLAVVYGVAVIHTRRSDRLLVSTSRITVVGSVDTILTLPDFSQAAGSLGYVGNSIYLSPDNISLDYDSGGDGGSDDDDDTPSGGGGSNGGGGSGGEDSNPL